jgi:hypothetical protein
MPLMTMHRNWTVSSTRGHTIQFKKNEPVYVPGDINVIELCRQYGAEYADAADADVHEGEDQAALEKRKEFSAPKSAAERNERVMRILRAMHASPDQFRERFTATGRPNARFVQSEVGFDVSPQEVEQLWNRLVHPKPDDD